MKTYLLFSFLLTSVFISISCQKMSSESAFNIKEKQPSESTIKNNLAMFDELDFDDNSDFDDATRGFIAGFKSKISSIADQGITYDPDQFNFLKSDAPLTVNPSLWRQSQLVSITGLFKVVDGIYQVRGLDLANVSFIRGKKGWIVIDPLTTSESARAALKILQNNVANLPVSAVILTHSHVDHFGGINGVLTDEQMKNKSVPIIASKNFLHESVSENIYAGNAMSRRAGYMYADGMNYSETGPVGSGLGSHLSLGEHNIAMPNTFITDSTKEVERMMVDGVAVDFIFTPGAEAPTELMAYFPKFKALLTSEIITRTFHNIYTLRGAKVRSAKDWVDHIQFALEKFGNKSDVAFASHHWPSFGNDNVISWMKGQRDLYKQIHDQTLHMANKGMTPLEIADSIKLNKNITNKFYNRGYYGSIKHNSRAVYNYYLGFFNGNPSQLDPLPISKSSKKYIRLMGGENSVLKAALSEFKEGNYRFTAEILNKLVFANPKNKDAKLLLADTYEQLGYQAESGPWRNFYLRGALELRGKSIPKKISTVSPGMILAMTNEMLLDFMAIRLDSNYLGDRKYSFVLNLVDQNVRMFVNIENGVLNYSKLPERTRVTSSGGNINLYLNKLQLAGLATGKVPFSDLGAAKIKVTGETKELEGIDSSFVNFKPNFNIIEP